MTAAKGIAAGDGTGYSQITSQTPYPLGHLSPSVGVALFLFTTLVISVTVPVIFAENCF